jgi:PII-like signaling protein
VKLTAYFGEDARVEGRLVSDALLDFLERRGVASAVLLRGVEGFGHSHRLHAERFPDTAPKLPLVAMALDTEERLRPLLDEAVRLVGGGLVTLEATADADDPPQHATLTVLLPRRRGLHEALVELLRAHGAAAATVLLGVDGLLDGTRRRAAFLGRNAETPSVALAAGPGAALAQLLPAIAERFGDPPVALRRVQVCLRDGATLEAPEQLRDGALQQLTVHAGAHARAGRRPLALELVHRLRENGAAGATMLRSSWGYAGAETPHGDRVALVRQTPTVVVAIDRTEEIRRLWPLVEAVAGEAGLVTCGPLQG